VKVVSNSSPLIVLTKINRIDLLKHLFTAVYISEEVYREVYKIKKGHCPRWIKVVKVKGRMAVDALDAIVDKGEAETIILAKEMNIKQVLMDDRKGVNLARKMGLEPLRTTTIIGIAYKNDLLTDIQKELLNLREKGYWITDYYIEEITKRFKDH
jgi:predicted nucleic acid-binding protein